MRATFNEAQNPTIYRAELIPIKFVKIKDKNLHIDVYPSFFIK